MPTDPLQRVAEEIIHAVVDSMDRPTTIYQKRAEKRVLSILRREQRKDREVLLQELGLDARMKECVENYRAAKRERLDEGGQDGV